MESIRRSSSWLIWAFESSCFTLELVVSPPKSRFPMGGFQILVGNYKKPNWHLVWRLIKSDWRMGACLTSWLHKLCFWLRDGWCFSQDCLSNDSSIVTTRATTQAGSKFFLHQTGASKCPEFLQYEFSKNHQVLRWSVGWMVSGLISPRSFLHLGIFITAAIWTDDRPTQLVYDHRFFNLSHL